MSRISNEQRIRNSIAYYEQKRDECLKIHCDYVAAKHQRMIDSLKRDLLAYTGG